MWPKKKPINPYLTVITDTKPAPPKTTDKEAVTELNEGSPSNEQNTVSGIDTPDQPNISPPLPDPEQQGPQTGARTMVDDTPASPKEHSLLPDMARSLHVEGEEK